MLAAGLLGGPLLASAAGAGAAGLGALALLGGGGSGGSGGEGDGLADPTVDDPDSTIAISGSDPEVVTVTGTGNPGSSVAITVDGDTVTSTVADDGTWAVVIEGEAFPEDGDYGDLLVVVTEVDGTVVELDGPALVIDTTPPDLTIESGAVSTGDQYNAEAYDDGVTLTGTAEVGSAVTVTVGTTVQEVSVGPDGAWAITFDATTFPGGEYDQAVTVTAVDSFGNTTVINDTVAVDTVPNALTLDAVTGDDLISYSDAYTDPDPVDGSFGVNSFAISGTTEAGASVSVTVGGNTYDVVAGDDGVWSITVDGSIVGTAEESTLTVTATTTDAFGNVSTVTRDVAVDTYAEVALTNAPLTGDDIVNAAEHASGLTLTGTSQAGSSVEVRMFGESYAADVADDGSWTLTVPPASLPTGTQYTHAQIIATDTAGNTASAWHFIGIDTETAVTIDSTTGGADGVINAEERAEGVVLSGTAEPGATLTITIGDMTYTTTALAVDDGSVNDIVDAVTPPFELTYSDDGVWSITLPTEALPEGVANPQVIVTSVDALGNSATTSTTLNIDTETSVSFTPGAFAGDGIVNNQEQADGVTVTGAAEPGATVVLSYGGADTVTVTAGDDGAWSAEIPGGALPTGQTSVDLTVTATDLAGNTATATRPLAIDTLNEVTIDTSASDAADNAAIGVQADGTINATERADGVMVSGTTDAGATVVVTAGTASLTTLADASGAWSVTVPADDIPEGTYDLDITATSTDPEGNVVSTQAVLPVDTDVALTVDTGAVEGDGIVNAVERQDGVPLSGTSEPGATVVLTIDGQDLPAATADASGNWTVLVPATLVPEGTLGLPVTATATDLVGNTVSASGALSIDTENALTIATDDVTADGVVNAAERTQGVTLTGTGEPGATVEVTVNGNRFETTVDGTGAWSVGLGADVIPAGTDPLPVTAISTDAAGNQTVATGAISVDTETAVTVAPQGLGGDSVLNHAERLNGLMLAGTAEPGSTVVVTLGAVSRNATIEADGSWSAQFFPSDVPTGETTVPVAAVATDAYGNTATSTAQVNVDTLVRDFAMTDAGDIADGMLTGPEAADGLTLTGTVEPGSVVEVALDGVALTATVSGGTWSVTYPPGSLPDGERSVDLVITATDAAQNTATETRTVQVDTVAGTLTIDPDPIETDDVVNEVEASDGVTITGTSDPGRVVTVTLGGASKAVLTAADGTWQADFAPGEIVPGTYTADITATISDSVGNVLTRTDTVRIDTEVTNFGFADVTVAGDDVISGAEAMAGVQVSGTTEPGSRLWVRYGALDREVDVDPVTGEWSLTLTGADLPLGESAAETLTVDTIDPAGNTATADLTFAVDRIVNELSLSPDPITADDVVNSYEATNGVTLTGRVEPGSSVMIEIQGVAYEADVEPDGRWSLDVPAGVLPQDYSGDLPITIAATDRYGNTLSIDETIAVDTALPDLPEWRGYGRDIVGLDEIRIETTEDDIAIGHVIDGATGPEIEAVTIDPANSFDVPALGTSYLGFETSVPDGSHLVMTATDSAGNTSGAYLVSDDPMTNDVTFTDNLAQALAPFEIELIDLDFAEDSQLSITEAQILQLSQSTDRLVVEGGSDDSVTITGAQSAGQVMQEGETYNAYTLGQATVLIDDDITNVVI